MKIKNTIKNTIALILAAVIFTGSVQLGGISAYAASAPPTPDSLKAVSVSGTGIKLSWDKSKRATGYVVYRYNTKTKAYSRIKVTSETSFTNIGLVTGTTYYYKISAYRTVFKKNLYSKPTEKVEAKPVPSAPGSLKAVSAGSKSIKISWSAVSGASGYVVYRYNPKTKAYSRVKLTSSTSYINTELVTGTTYYYKVSAYCTVSRKNIYSKPTAKVAVKPLLSAPGSVKAVSAGSKSNKISWSAVNGATGYVVFCFSPSNKSYRKINAKNKTSCIDTGLDAGRIYYYKVSAYKTVSGKNIFGNLSATSSATPLVGGTKKVSYTWKFDSKNWTFSKSFSNDAYNKCRYSNRTAVDRYDYSYYATNPNDDKWMKDIVKIFKELGAKEGYSDFEVSGLMTAFVQSLDYISDGKVDHPNFPMETLYNRGGDCEDTSILLAELMRAMGYETVLIALGTHMGVGINIDLVYNRKLTTYEYDGKNYYYIESVGKNYVIGQLPVEFKGIKATVIPLF